MIWHLLLKNCTIYLFADDTKLYIRVLRNQVSQFLLDDLHAVFNWCKVWQLSLALSKCAILPIRGIRSDSVKPKYVINGTELETVEHARDLGDYVSGNLKPAYHISQIVRPAHRIECQIHRAFVSTDHSFQMQMFNTYVRPRLEYCSVIWNPYLKRDIWSLEKVQRRQTKRMAGLWNVQYEDRLIQLEQISLQKRRLCIDLIMLFNIVHGLCAIKFETMFKYTLY